VADHRHTRDADARSKPRSKNRLALVVGPIALLTTALAVTVGVLATGPGADQVSAEDAATTISRAEPRETFSRETVSRSDSRAEARELQEAFDLNAARTATLRAVRAADTRLWTTTDLNLWSNPGKDAANVGLLESGRQVLVTGRKTTDRVEVVVEGKSRWVTAGYLAEEKPKPEPKPEPEAAAEEGAAARTAPSAPAGLSMDPCPDPGVESGLTSDAVYVYRSVCHAFPQITSYGGWDAHGEHASGRALDIMTSDVDLGNAIAAFLQAHAAELNLYDIIWRQHIWTPARASEGWRAMPSRGSATADHYDHVHVATNG
jgi:hypothetical protein